MKIPEILESVLRVIQNFCCGPDILDQLFRFNRNAVYVPDILETVFDILPDCCARSKNSGNCVLDHKERKCKFQKFWNRCCGSYRNSVVVQKFWTSCFNATKMLCTLLNFWRRCLGSYQNAVRLPEILGTVLCIWKS